MGIFEKFKIGFKKSASTFASGLKDIIVKKEIDDKNNIHMKGPVSEVKEIDIKL